MGYPNIQTPKSVIDFTKPLRVKRDHAPLKECTSPFKVMHDGAVSFLVHGITGKIFKFTETPDVAENIPEKPQPRRRYQAQYGYNQTSNWHEDKSRAMDGTDFTPGARITAWLIETDHGPDATERYTYERQEV